jgi:hypothetical protein
MSVVQPPPVLYHVTHRTARTFIDVLGLQPGKAMRSFRVWFCDLDRLRWAVDHVCETHAWKEEDTIILTVHTDDIASRLLRKRDGVWYTSSVIDRSRLGRDRHGNLMWLTTRP